MIDLRYWCAMFLAGVFGTIFGDLVGHALTWFVAFLVLGVTLAIVISARTRFAPSAIIGYWTIVLVERAAGTPLGDWLDSLDVPLHRYFGTDGFEPGPPPNEMPEAPQLRRS